MRQGGGKHGLGGKAGAELWRVRTEPWQSAGDGAAELLMRAYLGGWSPSHEKARGLGAI